MATATEAKPATDFDIAVLQEALARCIGFVSRAMTGRPTNPILSTIALDTDGGRLRLRATDLDLAATTWCGAMVLREGGVCVDARQFGDLINSLPGGTVELRVDGRRLLVVGGRRKGELATQLLEDYPLVSPVTESGVEIPPAALKQAIAATEFCASADNSRPVLTGINLGQRGKDLVLAAADGFRLAIHPLDITGTPGDLPTDITIPARALREIARIADTAPIDIAVNDPKNRITFRADDQELTSSLLQGKYPNFAPLIPTEHTAVVTVKAADLASVLKTAAGAVKNSQNDPVRMEWRGDALRCSGKTEEGQVWEGEIDGTVAADAGMPPLRIALSARYLTDAIGGFPKDSEIALSWTTPNTQLLFTSPQVPGYEAVVMPLFVQWGE